MLSSRYSMNTDIRSGMDSLSSSHSRHRRDGQRKSRRQSRLLYAEKYGLNSPLNDTDSDNDSNDDSDQHDDHDNHSSHPLSLKQRSHSYSCGVATFGRPRSLFNLLEPSKTAQRPAAFVKPTTATTTFGTPPSTVPNDMLTIQQLYEQYHKKVYIESFVYKRNTCNTDGSLCQDDWIKLYVELCGPILFLWDCEKLNKDGGPGSDIDTNTILPYYINISDATATLVDNNNNNNDTPILMMLNTAGRNQYLIRPEPPTLSAAQHWITAIRLSCFECARLYEIYTRYLLLRPNYQPLWHSSSSSSSTARKRKRLLEGYVQARFTGDTEWKKYWAVAYDQRNEKRFFGKTKKVPCKSQFMFYESKKSKYPLVTLVNILYAYTLYPQSPQLIDQATMFKVEGTTMTTINFKTGEQSMTHASAGTLLMTATTNDMMKWIVGIFDIFKLYGRPSSLLDDPMNPKALNFGEMVANDGAGLCFGSMIGNNDDNDNEDDNDNDDDIPQLFLEYPEVMHLSISQDETLLDSKMAFTRILADKLKNRSSTKTTSHPPLYAAKTRANSAPLLTNLSPPSDCNLNQHTKSPAFIDSPLSSSMVSLPYQRSHPINNISSMPHSRSRAMVYASDDSSDDDKSYSDQSDDESISIKNGTPQLTATHFKKETHTPSEPNTPSSPASLHQSTHLSESITSDEEYETKVDPIINSPSTSSNDMMGFAKNLLSKTFGIDYLTTATIDDEMTTIPSTTLSSTSQHSPTRSPVLEASMTNNMDMAPTNHKPPVSKRISVMPLASDDDDDDSEDDNDDDNKTDDDDDDQLIHHRLLKNMKITTSPSFTKRPISTPLSTSSTTTGTTNTPTTPGTNRSSAETTTSTMNQYQNRHSPYFTKQPSVHMQPSSSSPRHQSSIGMVYQIDTIQQQQQQQSLWENESLIGPGSRLSSYPCTLPQQQQTWENGSMCGSVSGPDSRMSMYRHRAGSVYGGGSVYGNTNVGPDSSVYGGSVYGHGDDYQKMMATTMMMTPGQQQQPSVQVDVKKPLEPRSGLIGMISQLEDEKREKEKNRFASPASIPLEQQQQQQYHDQLLYQQQQLLHQQQQQQQMMLMMNPMMMNPMMMNPMMMNSMMMMQQQQQQQWAMMKNGSDFYLPRQPLIEEEDDMPLVRPTINRRAPDSISSIGRQSVGRF